MSARRVTYMAHCVEPGCRELGLYEFASQKERRESNVVNRPWLCVRHSQPDRVVTPDRPRVEWQSEPVREWPYGKLAGGAGLFIDSHAYYADVKDFPAGTTFKITFEAIAPDSLSDIPSTSTGKEQP